MNYESKEAYFEGWYIKCAGTEPLAIILAIHRDAQGTQTQSVQLISRNQTWEMPLENLAYSRKPLSAMGKGVTFSENGLILDLEQGELRIRGSVAFSHRIRPAYDIMGPFSAVPGMQCRHSVFHLSMRVCGKLEIGGRTFVFHNSPGYLEGDRGRSFPQKYVWTQAPGKKTSVFLSVADIPLGSLHFNGCIADVWFEGKEYRLATYLGCRIVSVEKGTVRIAQGPYTLEAKLLKRQAHPLKAPLSGEMTRVIHESVACRARYTFCRAGEVLFSFESDLAGFEYEWDDKELLDN